MRLNRWCLGPLAAVLLIGCSSYHSTEPKPSAKPAAQNNSSPPQPADNSYCYVCHVNYQEESLVRSHQPVGVGCEKCHGLSAKHSADEDNLTAPDTMYAEARINPFCQSCHPQEKLLKTESHRDLFAAVQSQPQQCTVCHGEHRLKNRTRRWDKNTGKLLWKDGGPVMDR